MSFHERRENSLHSLLLPRQECRQYFFVENYISLCLLRVTSLLLRVPIRFP